MPKTFRTQTCQCGRESKRLFYTEVGKRCGDCIKREGLKKTGAPQWRSRAVRLNESLDAIRGAVGCEDEITDLGELEDLQSEMEEWRDNMAGTNLEYSQKYETVSEAADALERGVEELEAAHSTYNDALATLQDARQKVDDAEEEKEGEAAEQSPEEAVTDAESALESAVDEVENALSEFENVEFPGMYG